MKINQDARYMKIKKANGKRLFMNEQLFVMVIPHSKRNVT
jgi:hypothetical protein